MEHFLRNSGMPSCNLSNNVAPYELFYGVLHRSESTIYYFFAQMTSCAMRYDVICHPFLINSQYLKMWGLTALYSVCQNVSSRECCLEILVAKRNEAILRLLSSQGSYKKF